MDNSASEGRGVVFLFEKSLCCLLSDVDLMLSDQSEI